MKIYGSVIRTSQEYLAEMMVEGGTQGVSKYTDSLEPELFMGSVRFDEFPIFKKKNNKEIEKRKVLTYFKHSNAAFLNHHLPASFFSAHRGF